MILVVLSIAISIGQKTSSVNQDCTCVLSRQGSFKTISNENKGVVQLHNYLVNMASLLFQCVFYLETIRLKRFLSGQLILLGNEPLVRQSNFCRLRVDKPVTSNFFFTSHFFHTTKRFFFQFILHNTFQKRALHALIHLRKCQSR